MERVAQVGPQAGSGVKYSNRGSALALAEKIAETPGIIGQLSEMRPPGRGLLPAQFWQGRG